MTRRRFAVMVGLVVGVLVPSPAASAAPTATIVSAMAYCDVNDFRGMPACPRESQRLTGYAAATATADVAARTFRVSAVAQPNRRFVGQRYASSIVDLQSNEVTSSSGGEVKVVLTNLTGGNATRCPARCETLGQASAGTAVWVHLQLRGGGGSNSQQALCPISYEDEVVPPTFVVPDDCGPDVSLYVPPNSTFTVGVRLMTQAVAEGGAAKAQSALAGEVHEIRVP